MKITNNQSFLGYNWIAIWGEDNNPTLWIYQDEQDIEGCIKYAKKTAEAIKAYRKIIELFGSEWESELKRLEEASREI